MEETNSNIPELQTAPSTAHVNPISFQMAQNSPIVTRARARQLHLATLYTGEGTQIISTTPEFAYVPGTTPHYEDSISEVNIPITQSPNDITQSTQNIPIGSTAESYENRENAERRYVHLGPTISPMSVQKQTEDLQQQTRILSAKQKIPTEPETQPVSSPQAITIVSKEPVFPAPQPRVYKEEEKLQGQSNFHTWKRMILRDLRTSNLMVFIESPLGHKTSWMEATRVQGDALTQKMFLQAVSQLIEAQIYYCKNAFEMWVYIQFAYEDINALQLNTAVREVDKIVPEACSSVHEIFDKLVALQTQSKVLGENLPESYWLTEANRLVSDLYPRETCEALQNPNCTLMLMRKHFQTFVKEPNIRRYPMVYNPYAPYQTPGMPATYQQYAVQQPQGINYQVTPSPFLHQQLPIQHPAMSPPLTNAIPQPAPIAYPPPTQVTTPALTPLKARIQASARFRPQYLPSTTVQQQQSVPFIPPMLQPRYPPPTSYLQTVPNKAKDVCYSCGLSGHRAEFCPNFGLPVCYKCKSLGHKRPQCPCYWLPDDKYSPQPLVSPASIRPLLQLPPTTTGTVFNITTHSSTSSSRPVFLLDSGATHHVVSDLSLLLTFTPKPTSHTIYLADKLHVLNTIGYGTISITVSNPPNVYTTLTLSNVLVCGKIAANIISIKKMCMENEVTVVFTKSSASVLRYSTDDDYVQSTTAKINDTHIAGPSPKVPGPPIDEFSPKASLSPTEESNIKIRPYLPSLLFTLTNVHDLYSFSINIRAFSELLSYDHAIQMGSRDPRPHLTLNVIRNSGILGEGIEQQEVGNAEGGNLKYFTNSERQNFEHGQKSEGENFIQKENSEGGNLKYFTNSGRDNFEHWQKSEGGNFEYFTNSERKNFEPGKQ